jgi:glycosyltransferase involved in cell wall biosynthesis
MKLIRPSSPEMEKTILMFIGAYFPGYEEFIIQRSANVVQIVYHQPYSYMGGPLVELRIYRNGMLSSYEKFCEYRILRSIGRVNPVFLHFLAQIYSLRAMLRPHKRFDLVFISSVTPLSLLMAKSRIAKRRLFLSADPYENLGETISRRVLRAIITRIDLSLQNVVDEVWYISNGVFESKRRLGLIRAAKPRFTVPNPIVKEVRPDAAVNRHQFVYVGALGEKRGIEAIFDAFSKILIEIPDAKFIIIGVIISSYEEKFRSLLIRLNGSVEFLDLSKITEQEVSDIVSKCAFGLCIYEYWHESYPTKVRGYISRGVPVIMSNTTQVADLVKKYSAGIVINVQSGQYVSDLTNAMMKLMTDDVFWKSCREGVAKLADKLLEENPIASRLSELLS